MARRALAQASWPVPVATLALYARLAGWLGTPADPAALAPLAADAVAVLALVATGLLSAVIAFDGILFRAIASYPDPATGAAAVDDLLARMRLKPMPPAPRPLDDRRRGTLRLILLQRAALVVFVLALLAARQADRLAS